MIFKMKTNILQVIFMSFLISTVILHKKIRTKMYDQHQKPLHCN